MSLRLGIRHHAMALAIAGVVELGFQALLPVLLVRVLTRDAFGDYRLVWLIAVSGQAIFNFFMPQSLFYFLPRATPSEKRLLIGNTSLFLLVAGIVAGVLFAIAMPYFSPAIQGLSNYSMAVPIFLSLWIASSIFDTLAIADGRAEWQAVAVVALAVGRALLLALAAVSTRDVSVVIWFMCLFALIRVIVPQIYALRASDRRSMGVDTGLLGTQIRYSFPFAIATGLFYLRLQADQWVVASSFAPATFALVSIATIILMFSTLIRDPINNALRPKFNALLGNGDLEQARVLLTKGYMGVALALVPVLGMVFVAAHELVELVYTRTYLDAAPIMQVYLVGQIAGVFAAGHLLSAVNLGRQTAIANVLCFLLSITLSIVGVRIFGVIGAPAGSAISILIMETWSLFAVARSLDTTPSKIVNWPFSVKVLATVIVAVAVALIVRAEWLVDMQPFARLLAETAVYTVVAGIGMVVLGVHTHGLTVLRSLLRFREA